MINPIGLGPILNILRQLLFIKLLLFLNVAILTGQNVIPRMGQGIIFKADHNMTKVPRPALGLHFVWVSSRAD